MEYSSFFNSKSGDRKYKAEDWDRHLKDLISNGIFAGGTNLQVTADGDGMAIVVQPGSAWINGKHYLSDIALTFPVDVADGALNRKDRVVLQLSTADRAINLQIKKGAFASAAEAPALQRDADVYELGLAIITINAGAIAVTQSMVTDTRLDTAACGLVHELVDRVIDTDALYAQIQDDLRRFRTIHESDFDSWSVEQKTEFVAWMQTLKDTLSGDVAGNLLNLINNHKSDSVVHVTGEERNSWNNKANHYYFAAALPASGWTGDGPYVQTVSVPGMTADMNPIMDLVQSDTVETAQAQLDAYACISRATTADGSLTAICYDDKPDTDITVQLEAVV